MGQATCLKPNSQYENWNLSPEVDSRVQICIRSVSCYSVFYCCNQDQVMYNGEVIGLTVLEAEMAENLIPTSAWHPLRNRATQGRAEQAQPFLPYKATTVTTGTHPPDLIRSPVPSHLVICDEVVNTILPPSLPMYVRRCTCMHRCIYMCVYGG